MRTEIRNRLARSRQDVAAEIPASRPDRRAFVGVWPYGEGYRVWRFEVPAAALVEMIANDRHLTPEEMLDGVGFTVGSIEEVEQRLAELNIDSDLLDVPWASDYPL
jgi:hypothetical protein